MPIGSFTIPPGNFLRQGACARRILLALLGLALVAAPASARVNPLFEGLNLELQGETYLLSFRLAGALTPEIQERIHLGMRVEFTYEIEYLRRRTLWGPRIVAVKRFVVGLQYDPAPDQYSLWRQEEGGDRVEKKAETYDEAVAWLTTFLKVPAGAAAAIAPEKGERGPLFWRVSATILEKEFLLFFPSDVTASSERLPVPQPRPDAVLPAYSPGAPAPAGPPAARSGP